MRSIFGVRWREPPLSKRRLPPPHSKAASPRESSGHSLAGSCAQRHHLPTSWGEGLSISSVLLPLAGRKPALSDSERSEEESKGWREAPDEGPCRPEIG